MPRVISIFALLVICLAASVSAAEQIREPPPKLGLVLAGGGARGAAHVGVLKILDELDIRPDVIAGTSMGAIIGGLYATGLSADEIEQILNDIDWDRAFADTPGRAQQTMRRKQLDRDFLVKRRLGLNQGGFQVPLGALQGQHLDQILKRILSHAVSVKDFDDLPVPFRAVATDIVTGEPVILGQGSLVQAIRASMSVPGVFAPVIVDDRMLVDGGLAMNTPVEVAAAMGAERLIVVDLSIPMLERDEIRSVINITEQISNLLTRRNTQASLEQVGAGDVVIVPDLGDISSAEFDRAAEAVGAGERAARANLKQLRQIAGARAAPEPLPNIVEEAVVVGFIDIHNTSDLNDSILRARVRHPVGGKLDLDRLESDLDAIYALDVFDVVRYEIVRDDERGTGILITAEERHWGPNYLQFGMALTSDFDAVSDFTLGAAYTRNALNRLGGDLRVSGSIGRFTSLDFDLYQPLDLGANWFVRPQLFGQREHRDFFIDDFSLGTAEIDNWGVRLGGGRNFGHKFQLRANLEWSKEKVSLVRGLLDGVEVDYDIAEAGLGARYDSLNNINFPTRGAQFDLEWRRSLDELGADEDWNQYRLTGVSAISRGRHTYLARVFAGLNTLSETPFPRQYRLGGFGQLSGYAPDSLVDRQAAVAAVTWYRRIGDIRFFPVYGGLSVEAGNVWPRRSDMSLSDLRYSGAAFLGADTAIGPLYLAWGRSDEGDNSFYFYLGNPFELRWR